MDSVFEVLIVYFIWLSFNFYFHIYLKFFSYVNSFIYALLQDYTLFHDSQTLSYVHGNLFNICCLFFRLVLN